MPTNMLQQYLPFTVLKHTKFTFGILFFCLVATVLTVYGIETYMLKFYYLVELLQQYLPFTVLKQKENSQLVTFIMKLQQYLPFTVLKHLMILIKFSCFILLQQYLPFTVLKH